jgi:hypothetical protein
MEILVYGAEKVATSTRRQVEVRLRAARQVATKWSEADCDRAIE